MKKNEKQELNTEVKEQRVDKNNGKRFEVDFKASFQPHIWTYRPTDSGGGQNARFTIESICDLMAFDTKTRNFILMELKSTLGTSVSFKSHEFCENYEKEKEKLAMYLASTTVQERKQKAEEIKEKKRAVRMLYKETNAAMIKYHQILELKKAKEEHDIESYLVFKFFRTTKTYAMKINSFIDFWEKTPKKSINEKDLEEYVENGGAFAIPQGYIRRSKMSVYDPSELTK